MSAKWRRGFDPSVIVQKFSSIRILDGEKVSFNSIEYTHYIAVLKSMIELSDDISPDIFHSLVVNGFHEAAKRKELKASNIIEEIKKSIRERDVKPDKSYYLVTTLNIDPESKINDYTINGCKFRFYKNLPNKYMKARNDSIESVSDWLIDQDEFNSIYLVASVKAKDEHEAVDRIMDSIDLLRGIWNLHINNSMVISFGGRKKPINKIILGALHTLHKADGSKACDSYWYEPTYYKNHASVDFSKKKYKTLEFTKNVRKRLRSSRYKKDIESAIMRYVRALDSQDYDSSFIKLWSVLEYLTSTLYDSYDKTIKRTAFLFSDRSYHKQVLEHLRQYRNRSLHSGAGENDIDTHVYQLKNYVEHLLRFHIGNHFKFSDLSEAAKFMDLQPDTGVLKQQIALRQSGIEYLGG